MSALARDKEFTKEARRLKQLESKVNNIKYQILESPDLAGEHLQMLLGEIKHKSESSGQIFLSSSDQWSKFFLSSSDLCYRQPCRQKDPLSNNFGR